MQFETINFRTTSPADLLKLCRSGELKLNKANRKNVREMIIDSVGSANYRIALNSCALGFLTDTVETLEIIHRKGLFRYSNYITRKCVLQELVEALSKFIIEAGIKDERLERYLRSVANFSYLQKEYIRLRTEILNEFKRFSNNYKGYSLLKTLVVHADYLFLLQILPPPDYKGNMNSIYSRSKEEISSATSYLIFLLTTVKPSSINDGSKVADAYIISGEIYSLLLPAALIEDYKELELLIEHYGYSLNRDKNEYHLIPPETNFERDMRLGYIRTQTQALNTGMSFAQWPDRKEFLSIAQVAEALIKIDDFIQFEFVGVNDYPRYRIKMPDFAYEILHEKLFNDEGLFEEEAYHFAWVFNEQLMTLDTLKEVYISDNLRLFDFIKIRRYFLFMHFVYEQHFARIGKIEPAWLLHSLVPQLNDNHLEMMFGSVDNQKLIDEFMNVVCWEPGDNQLFDLQYQPVLYINSQYLIPFNILGQVNTVRNLYALEYKKQNKNLLLDGVVDPLTNRLSNVLTSCGVENIIQLNYGEGDIDIVALMEDTLIFIECKHSLHPGDLYELRRTYDYVKKAESQLDRALDYFQNRDLIYDLEKSFKKPLKEHIQTVLTLIVTSNRILSGNNFRHPVRDINDLDNFITRGTFVTNDGVFSLYNSDHFQLSELRQYILQDSIALNHMREILQKYTQVYQTPKETLLYDTYFLDIEHALKELRAFTKTLRFVKRLDD